jgi:hypothetical protein
MYSASMQPVHSYLSAALATLLRNAPLNADKVACAWRAAVGPAVDRATDVSLEGSVLRVRARDDAWRREVERSVGLVRTRLDALLGAGIVTTIEVTCEGTERRITPDLR